MILGRGLGGGGFVGENFLEKVFPHTPFKNFPHNISALNSEQSTQTEQ